MFLKVNISCSIEYISCVIAITILPQRNCYHDFQEILLK